MLFNKPVSRCKSNSVIVFNIFIGMFVLIQYIHAVTMALIFIENTGCGQILQTPG